MPKTPHSWDDIVRFLSGSTGGTARPAMFLLALVAHLKQGGKWSLLAPLYSHGTLHLFSTDVGTNSSVVISPPSNGIVHLELLSEEGGQTLQLRHSGVP